MENVKPLYVNFESCSKTPQELLTAVELLIFEMLSDLQIDNKDAANIYEDILEDFIHCKEKREFFVNWAKETKNINLKFFLYDGSYAFGFIIYPNAEFTVYLLKGASIANQN